MPEDYERMWKRRNDEDVQDRSDRRIVHARHSRAVTVTLAVVVIAVVVACVLAILSALGWL